MVMLADQQVIAALAGVDTGNQQPRLALSTVHSFSLSIDLRLHLCHLALTHYTPQHDWSVWITPVGYPDRETRKKWYLAAGSQARILSTFHDFLRHATHAIKQCGKTHVAGLFTHWVQRPNQIDQQDDITQINPATVWNRFMMKRYGSIVVLRVIRSQTGDKLQIVIYDPSVQDKKIWEQYKHSTHSILNHRLSRLKCVEVWANDNGCPIHSSYLGGYLVRQSGDDSVTACFDFLKYLLSAGNMADALPEHDDRSRFEWMGFKTSA
jgi:hypothetical protein